MPRNLKLLGAITLLVLCMSYLAACSPLKRSIIKIEQEAITGKILLQRGTSVGQTCVARYDGLESITLYLEPDSAGDGYIVVFVYPDPNSSSILASGRLALNSILQPDYYTIPVQVLPDSTDAYYYFKIETQGTGAVQIGIAGGDTYLNGALYQDGVPQNAQMAFRLGYESSQLLVGLVKELVSWLGLVLAGLLLFIIPGWALLSWLWPGWSKLHWGAKAGLSSGISLAIYPIMLLWTRVVGIKLGSLYAWLPALAGLLALGWRNRQLLNLKRHKVAEEKQTPQFSDLAITGVICLIFLVRFWAVRSLEAPMWGDSYYHTVMAQLIVDNKGLFDAWQPYASTQSFTYHYGFHSLAAVLYWVTGLPMRQSVLWTAQILNGLAVISLLPLVLRKQRNPWAGVAALLLAGLILPMPMYYVNWGRYTQLAGQVILPGAVYIAWEILENRGISRRMYLAGWLALAGLGLTHYRILILGLCFLAAAILLNIRSGYLLTVIRHAFWFGCGALVLFLPWFNHLFTGRLTLQFSRYVLTSPDQVTDLVWQLNNLDRFERFMPVPIWLLLGLVTIWGFVRRKRFIILIGLWWLLILLVTNPHWLGLPGVGLITNFAIAIAVYIPAGLIIGEASGELIAWLLEYKQSNPGLKQTRYSINIAWRSLILFGLVMLGGLWASRQRLWDINPFEHSLLTRPDLQAVTWINNNLPEEARFLVNSLFSYEGTVLVGSDAGWWLPLLTKRNTTLLAPHQGYEKAPPAETDQWKRSLARIIQTKGPTDPEVVEILHQGSITHVYIGQRQGSVNNPGAVLDPTQFLTSSDYISVYHQDRVWIFELLPH